MPCSPPAAPTPSTATLAAYTLTANVENGRILATVAANLTGNTLNNVLYAGAGNNVLDGGTGIDTVSYAYGLAGTSGVTVSLAVAPRRPPAVPAATR
jgi:Ca2+-binding RTX toxin-like protein